MHLKFYPKTTSCYSLSSKASHETKLNYLQPPGNIDLSKLPVKLSVLVDITFCLTR